MTWCFPLSFFNSYSFTFSPLSYSATTFKRNVAEIETHLCPVSDFSVKVSGNLLAFGLWYACVCLWTFNVKKGTINSMLLNALLETEWMLSSEIQHSWPVLPQMTDTLSLMLVFGRCFTPLIIQGSLSVVFFVFQLRINVESYQCLHN